jgi:hypothetical protein
LPSGRTDGTDQTGLQDLKLESQWEDSTLKALRLKGKPEQTRFCAEGKEDPKGTPPKGAG